MPQLPKLASGGIMSGRAKARAKAMVSVPAPGVGSPDAELLALERDIGELIRAADQILLTRVEPHDEAFENALDAGGGLITEESHERAWQISDERGRTSAIEECNSLLNGADQLFARMRGIEARGAEGRKAKVRALLTCVLGADWRGSAVYLDYEKQVTRELLGELAGMSAAELEAV
jgi:hypothetical protein